MALNRAKVADKAADTTNVVSEEEKALQAQAALDAAASEDHDNAPADPEPDLDPTPEPEPEPELEPEVEEHDDVVPEPEAKRRVAIADDKPVSNVTEQRANASAQFKSEMEEAGFEGMNVTGMSFDRVKLHEGKFIMGSGDGIPLGEYFDMQLLSTRDQFIVRQYDGDDAKVFFSYDPQGRTLTDGKSSDEILQEWREDGYGTEDQPLDIKKYLEGMAVLINREDEHEGTVVSLSIPPASAPRLAGAAVIAKQKYKALPSEVAIRAKVGATIKKGSTSFRPWVFTVVGLLDAAE